MSTDPSDGYMKVPLGMRNDKDFLKLTLPGQAIWLRIMMECYANHHGKPQYSWEISARQLAELFHCGRRTVSNTLRSLQKYGWIGIHKHRARTIIQLDEKRVERWKSYETYTAKTQGEEVPPEIQAELKKIKIQREERFKRLEEQEKRQAKLAEKRGD